MGVPLLIPFNRDSQLPEIWENVIFPRSTRGTQIFTELPDWPMGTKWEKWRADKGCTSADDFYDCGKRREQESAEENKKTLGSKTTDPTTARNQSKARPDIISLTRHSWGDFFSYAPLRTDSLEETNKRKGKLRYPYIKGNGYYLRRALTEAASSGFQLAELSACCSGVGHFGVYESAAF
ncbi:hypothetical protein CEXT_98601 [Caerostris extrusa]|uniref:Uncharacterized protein n=1 Tax=Caerostris extrusa TaxID=172846 RepID=A0AAV4XGH9_CAEEX|nr:hypothetical protein CEXT_98601 [Caerostris extrusa]